MFKIIEKDLSKESTIRTAASTKYYCIINNIEDIKNAVTFAKKNNLFIKILGNGSNILFSKKYYDTFLFLKLGEEFKFFKMNDKYVEIGASHSLIQAGRKLISHGFSDFIFFNLIPANIGGAIRQNAGTGPGEEMQDVCSSAVLFDINKLQSTEFNLKSLDFSYRNSIIKKNPERFLVLSAKFKLINKIKNLKKLELDMKDRVKEKLEREPKGYSFGSTFMNNKMFAWEYVDAIYNDLKLSDSTFFSKKHKNWIINKEASGQEILNLIRNTQKKVKKKFNIDLTEEIDII